MARILLRGCLQDSTTEFRVNWAYKLIKRHEELRIQYNQRVTYQRAKQEDPRVIQEWFESVYAVIQEYYIYEYNIWNFYETGFAMGLCSTSKVITAVERSEKPRTVIRGNCEWVTVIETISSRGIHNRQ